MYMAIGIAVLWIGGMLCWALYELGKLLHQVNATVTETRGKIKRIEHAVLAMKEYVSSLSGYASLIAQAGKSVSSYFGEKKSSGKKKKGKTLAEILEEE